MNQNNGLLLVDRIQETPAPVRERRRTQAWERLSAEVSEGTRLGPQPSSLVRGPEASHWVREVTCSGYRLCPRHGAGLLAHVTVFISQPVLCLGICILPYSLASWAQTE